MSIHYIAGMAAISGAGIFGIGSIVHDIRTNWRAIVRALRGY